MKKENLIKKYNELKSIYFKYQSYNYDLEDNLKKYIGFEFFISYQPSDIEFMVVNTDTAYNAPLNKCINIINKKGFLSLEDYEDICI